MAVRKKPKGKKRPPPPKPGTVSFEVTTVIPDVPVESITVELKGLSYLRRLAAVLYITSQSAISLTELVANSQFADVIPRNTMGNWCAQDKWVEQRQKYWAEIEDKLKSQISTAQVQARIGQVDALVKLTTKMRTTLDGDEVEPQSYEGMVNALTRAEKLVDELRSKVVDDITPTNLGGSGGQVPEQITPVLSDTEARAAALAVIKQRQAAAKEKNG